MKRTLLALSLLAAAPAMAEEVAAPTPCEASARNVCAPAGEARLVKASQGVLLSRGAGFSEVQAGAALNAGDRILVKGGSARLAMGQACMADLAKNAMVTLVRRGDQLCVLGLRPDAKTVAQAGSSSSNDGYLAPALIGGALGAGALAAIIVGAKGGDDARRAISQRAVVD